MGHDADVQDEQREKQLQVSRAAAPAPQMYSVPSGPASRQGFSALARAFAARSRRFWRRSGQVAIIFWSKHSQRVQVMSVVAERAVRQLRPAFRFIDARRDTTTEQQINICEVPAPTFHEEQRARYLRKLLSRSSLRELQLICNLPHPMPNCSANPILDNPS